MDVTTYTSFDICKGTKATNCPTGLYKCIHSGDASSTNWKSLFTVPSRSLSSLCTTFSQSPLSALSLHFYFPFFLLFIHLLILNLGNGPYDVQFLVMLCISNAIDYTLRFSNHSDWHLQFVMRCSVHTQHLSNAHMQLAHAQHVCVRIE